MDDDAGILPQVLEACGLARVIGASVIERACKRAGVSTQPLTQPGLIQALPSIETALKVYLSEAEVAERMSALRRLRPTRG